MKDKLLNTLTNIGLTDKEAKVYMAGMSLGPSRVQDIASAADVKRTTVYSILESLKVRGLFKTELIGWKTLYTAEPPEKLESLVETMRHSVRENLPEFNALYNLHSSGAFISYYEGIEGVKNAYEGLLRDIKPREDYLVIGDSAEWFTQDQEFFHSFLKRRAKLNINIRLLLQDTPTAREQKKMERQHNQHIKILPAGFKLSANVVMIPRRLILNQYKMSPLAMVIENESIIQTNRELFEIIWQGIKE